MSTPPVQAPATPTPPEDPGIFAVFCGPIDQNAAQKIVAFFTAAMNIKATKVHALFQTSGGYVGDGVFLYNFFRALPMELTLYNAGQICSAGITAYLGAHWRVTSDSATFMVHRSSNSPLAAGAAKLQNIAKSLVLDDARTESIYREHLTLTEATWTEMQFHNVYLSGAEAVDSGLANAIGNFGPPKGYQIHNMLDNR
jgi:ATP-dependent Clp protease protease subunit